jgi:hypothetical protein
VPRSPDWVWRSCKDVLDAGLLGGIRCTPKLLSTKSECLMILNL